MRAKTFVMISTALFVGTLLLKDPYLSAEPDRGRMVRLAELEIDPAHLELYKAALREEIATSIRVEPGPDAVCSVRKESPDPDQAVRDIRERCRL
jgi:hypothetical protein